MECFLRFSADIYICDEWQEMLNADGGDSDDEDDDSDSDEETPKKVFLVIVSIVIFLLLFYVTALTFLSSVDYRYHYFDDLLSF